MEGGLFESLLDEIFGIATHNFNLNIYNVTFKESTSKSLIEDLYETFNDPQEISIKNDIDCSLQINRPLGYRQLITFYPMLFDINLDYLKTITNKWETLKHFEFGKQKKCPMIHNPYLHIYTENFNRKEVPDQIIFRNRFIAINIDGKPTKTRCNYCKKTDHLIKDCPLKIQPKETQPPNKLPQPKQSYAQTVTSTPKTIQPPFLHPLTKMKLPKQNIKKTTQNFPSLNQNPTSPPNEKNNIPNSNTTSLTISQEEILKSFDNIQYAKIPLPTTSKENNPQIPLPLNESQIKKRKLSPSSQSSSISIDLKPRKKRPKFKTKNSV